jgi:ribose transport system substrate-binding protein
MNRLLYACVAAAIALAAPVSAWAVRYDDGSSVNFYNKIKGKKVAFVPISMGHDLPQGWAAGMESAAKRLGFVLDIRDPNWSVDAGAQIITSLIPEKPDIMVVQNTDEVAYAKLIKKAMEAGIKVIQMNTHSKTVSDAFVGADWYGIGLMQAEAMAKACGEDSGKSGKIAVIQGLPTAPSSIAVLAGIKDVLAKHPKMEIVALQAADWDATKAHAVASTVITQHSDLCGVIGMWDGMDIGIAAAIREEGKTNSLVLVTSGGGEKTACDNLQNGSFSAYVSYDVPQQARDLNDAIEVLLQQSAPAGSQPFALYTPNKLLTKDTLKSDSCWIMDELKHGGL